MAKQKTKADKMASPVSRARDDKKAILRIMEYMKEYRLRLFMIVTCVVLSSASNLAGSYMLRPIINSLTGFGGSLEILKRSLAAMGLIYLVGVLAQCLQARLMVSTGQAIIQRIRDQLFSKLQRLPVQYYDQNPHGDIMSRFTNDVDSLGEMLNTTIVQLISGFISLTGTLALMLYTNALLCLVTVVMVPVIMGAAGFIRKRSRRFYKEQQAALGALNGYIEELVKGQKVVKVFCHEEEAIEDFRRYNDELRSRQLGAQFFGGIMGPVMNATGQINYTITSVVGGLLCVLAGFDLGGMTVFINYSRQFSRPINELAMQMNTIYSALAGAERVFSVLDEPEPDQEPDTLLSIEEHDGSWYWILPEKNISYRQHWPEAVSSPGPSGSRTYPFRGGIVIEDMSFGYLPDKTVLKSMSLYAKPGQKIAFVGSTGAGKTTVTNLINRFYEINEGSIKIDGVDIRDIHKSSLRRAIAMVLQDTHLFQGTVRENIRYGRLDASDAEVIEAAKTVSAHSFIMHLEQGYDTVLEGDGVNLSQGQRQLLNIARAAISRAPILILDEATSSVDTRTERQIDAGMDRLMEDRTTLVIAHRLSTVRSANAIMVLENGEIIERGDHDQLLDMKGRYYELYTGASELE